MSCVRTLLTLVASALALGACATATPYQAATDDQRGYASHQIEQNRWTVSFSGNTLTERETVETYLLYRAAELTDQEGFDYFKVVTRETDEKKRTVRTLSYDPFYSGFNCHYAYYGHRGRLYGYPYYHPHYYRVYDPFYDPFFDGPFDYREIVRYEASAEIIMGAGETPESEEYFTADEVLMNLIGKIVRPQAS